MSEKNISDVLGMMPYGFYSITSRYADEVNAMVANWITQSSFEPRLVTLALQKTSYSHDMITKGKVFAVNLFKTAEAEGIKPFTKSRKKNPAKMETADFTPGPETGCPILAGATAYLECKVRQVVDVGGDHDLIVAEVVGAGLKEKVNPSDILSLPDLGWNYSG
jgi:flavin reductase (DIM6/NTAB) family NADH-FMN oxidoreductase RutF